MSAPLRAAVIGGGSTGRNHARIFADLDGANLVAVADHDDRSRAYMRQRYGVTTYRDHREMLAAERPDVVSVVLPIEWQSVAARDALIARTPVLLDKPIAASVVEGAALTKLATRERTLLMVGHSERFNPAIAELKRCLDRGDLGAIHQISMRRIGPFPSRLKERGVAVDLAAHDIELMHYLAGSQTRRLHAELRRRPHAAHPDMLAALIRFENGVLGALDVNWTTPTKDRQIVVVGERGLFVANYQIQELAFYPNGSAPLDAHWPELATLGQSAGLMERQRLAKREPLREQILAFVRAVAAGGPPVVSGEDSLRALMVANRLAQAGAVRSQAARVRT